MLCVKALLTILALPLAVACSESADKAKPRPAPAPKPAIAAPEPAPAPAAPVSVSANDLPPRQEVKGDGITITEFVDGRVQLKTTALWNEPIDTTFDNCDYYKKALPVLKRQIAKERMEQLGGICGASKATKSAKKSARAASKAPPTP